MACMHARFRAGRFVFDFDPLKWVAPAAKPEQFSLRGPRPTRALGLAPAPTASARQQLAAPFSNLCRAPARRRGRRLVAPVAGAVPQANCVPAAQPARPLASGLHSQWLRSSGARLRRAIPVELLALLVALLPSVCVSAINSGPALQRFEFAHPAMGTRFTITMFAPAKTEAEAAAEAAFHRVDVLEDIMSDYQADSELLQLCGNPAGVPVPVSADLLDVLQRAQKISERSHGAFDVTIGPFVRLWRFARKRKVLPTAAELSAAAPAVGYQNLRLDARHRTATLRVPHMRLDLGGIAKGYAADQALRVLKSRGLPRALVAASGDIAVGDAPPAQPGWRIGIAAIDAHANETTRMLILHNCGISTSGDTEQFIEIGGVRYSHILNPATGLGLTNRIQASVVAPDATTTDAAATAVCVLGVGRGLAFVDALPGAAALILTKQGDAKQCFFSRRFKQIPSAP